MVSRTALRFAVRRAHHADVGGMEPASLPALSRDLYQEGLIVPPVRLEDSTIASCSRTCGIPTSGSPT